jgi:NRAMP (natural resistance-associated macrophage protein)-like metal ion transporter
VRRRLALPALAVFATVAGPGIIAGLSDDDPAGITTYSILGAEYGYELLWVLALSVVALIAFHELGARMGIRTGRGLMLLVRERFNAGIAFAALTALVVANVGTTCAELAGVAASLELVDVPPWLSVPVAAAGVTVVVVFETFTRLEHVLLALSAVFVSYIGAAVLAQPDWAEAVHGLVVPSMPLDRDAALVATATVGTTLAPWGLAFIQSYAVDKRLSRRDLPVERIDVIVGALATGVIGACVVIACAATLYPQGITIDDASDAAEALEPLVGSASTALFGIGLLGAGLLAAAVVPLSTSYSVSETFGREPHLDERPRQEPLFYGTYCAVMAVAAVVVMVPGVPLVDLLFLTQALNAILLVPLLVLMLVLARDRSLLGTDASRGFWWWLELGGAVIVFAAVGALAVLAIL